MHMMTSDHLSLDGKPSSNFNTQHPEHPPAPETNRSPPTSASVFHNPNQSAPEAPVQQLWLRGVYDPRHMYHIPNERLAHARSYPYRAPEHKCIPNPEKTKPTKMKQSLTLKDMPQQVPESIAVQSLLNLPHRGHPDYTPANPIPVPGLHEVNHGVQSLSHLPPPPPHLSPRINMRAEPPAPAQPPPPSYPPPPPASLLPPPPASFAAFPPAPLHRNEHVSSPAALIPVNYSGESVQDTSRMVMIEPFKRNVLVCQHAPQEADLAEYMWLLKHGNTEVWYQKPQKAFFRQMKAMNDPYGLLEVPTLEDARPVSLETPKLWASRALTTPTDDDIYECAAGHNADGGYVGSCHRCSEEKSEALDATSLEYCLIMTSCQASNPFIHGSHFNGKQIYKMVKCGSREAAVSEAFYAAGVNGWNTVFSCVLRLGEGFDDKTGKVHRVEELWELAETDDEDDSIRVFY